MSSSTDSASQGSKSNCLLSIRGLPVIKLTVTGEKFALQNLLESPLYYTYQESRAISNTK